MRDHLGPHGDWVAWHLGWTWQPEAFRILMGDLLLLPHPHMSDPGKYRSSRRTERTAALEVRGHRCTSETLPPGDPGSAIEECQNGSTSAGRSFHSQ